MKNVQGKYLRLKKMDSDKSGHSESEFYYPEDEAFNQTMWIMLCKQKIITLFQNKKNEKDLPV